MKKIKTLKRLASVFLLLCLVVLTLASCGSSSQKADDAEGTLGENVNWVYKKDGKTLTLTGSGAMNDIVLDENGHAKAPWSDAQLSAEKIVVGEGIQTIGTYAFWGMNNVKEVVLPSTLTEIRDFSFAFCGNLTAVDLKKLGNLRSVGKGAFEGCGALESVYLPEQTTAIGESAFAYCSGLKSVFITASPAENTVLIQNNTFKNCRSLESLVFRSSVTADQIAANAFDGASKNFDNAEKTESPNASGRVTVYFVKEEAENKVTVKDPLYLTLEYGQSQTITPETVEGYTPDPLSVTVQGNGTNQTITVTYRKNEVATEETSNETQPAVETEEKSEGIKATTIIALVILGVVLVAIGVGAFFLIRSDKKAAKKNSATVRKNPPKKK